MHPFQTLLISLCFFISSSLNVYVNALDDWLELESNSLAPHKKIAISNTLLKQNQLINDKEGELYAYIQLALSSQSLENFQQSKQYLILAEQLNQQVNSTTARIKINNIQAREFSTEGKMNDAVAIMAWSLALSSTIDDVLLQGDTLMQYAYIMQLDSQHEVAIESLYKAQLIFEELEDNSKVMAVQSYLAMIYADLKNYPKAIEYYAHAVSFAKKLQDDFNLSIFYYNLGTAYSSLSDWQKSSAYFSQARELSRVLDDSVGIALATARLGGIMVKNHQYQDALPLLLEANNTLQDDGTVLMRTRLKLDIALSYAKQQKMTLTKFFLQEADTLSKDEKVNRYPYKLMGDVHRELGNYKRAATIYEAHIVRLNKEFKAKRESSLQRLEVAYDVQFEKSRNELLRKENLLKEAKLTQYNQYRLILVLVLALVLLILGATFRQIKIQRNHKQKFKDLAFKDELTQIANRRGILAFANACHQQLKINNNSLMIAVIDLYP